MDNIFQINHFMFLFPETFCRMYTFLILSSVCSTQKTNIFSCFYMLLDKQKITSKLCSNFFFQLENCAMLQIIFQLQKNIHTNSILL